MISSVTEKKPPATRRMTRLTLEIVGHSAIEITMNVYVHVSLDNQRAALELLNAQLVADDEGAR